MLAKVECDEGVHYLEVGGITVAVEGEPCHEGRIKLPTREKYFTCDGDGFLADCWTKKGLTVVAELLNAASAAGAARRA